MPCSPVAAESPAARRHGIQLSQEVQRLGEQLERLRPRFPTLIGEFTLPTQAKLLRVLEQRVVRPVGGERDIPFDVRFIAVTRTSSIVLDDLPPHIREHRGAHSTSLVDSDQIISLAEIERRDILHALHLLDDNKALAARKLGLDRKTLYRKLQRWEQTESS
jgi:transcriptional regulator of acetoin/glycerol metabolism